jgi:hypothetical protein
MDALVIGAFTVFRRRLTGRCCRTSQIRTAFSSIAWNTGSTSPDAFFVATIRPTPISVQNDLVPHAQPAEGLTAARTSLVDLDKVVRVASNGHVVVVLSCESLWKGYGYALLGQAGWHRYGQRKDDASLQACRPAEGFVHVEGALKPCCSGSET